MQNIVTIRPDLSDVLREYSPEINKQFMADKILPIFGTGNYNDTFWKIDITQASKTAPIDLERAPGGTYKRIDFQVTSDNYTCKDRGLVSPIDDRQRKQYKTAFDAETDTSLLVNKNILVENEKRAAALLFSTANFAGYTGDVTTEWSSTSGVPFADINGKILTLKQQVGGVIGSSEICLGISEKVFRNMIKTTEIQGLIKGGDASEQDKVFRADEMGAARLANILNINNVFFSPAQDNGIDIWDDEYALLFLRSTSNMLSSSVQLGRTFLWEEESETLPIVEMYRDEDARSDLVRVRHDSVQKVFAYQAGWLFSNITE